MSSFFDDILENKRFVDKQDLFKQFSKVNLTFEEESTSTSSLNEIFEKLEKDPNAEITLQEAKLVDEQNQKNIKEAKVVLKEINSIKDSIVKYVKESGDGFVLSLKNKSRLTNYANSVFGGNKTEITFEDYVTLLELKKLLDYEDASEMLFEEYK